ncbi:MAG: response regulator transcription factor [Gammaproteobacteria bacterium]|nr:response regulator transcription factor [Gammaproteobacteria bacterium]
MRVLIVDDESPARERLKRLILSETECQVVGEASNGVEAIAEFNRCHPDVILLDIRMPEMDGLETARHLMRNETPPAIIFTTAYSDHALEAFEAHAVDYLLKPVRIERLQEALTTAKRNTRAQIERVHDTAGGDAIRTHICVRLRGNLELIPIDDIVYFQAEHKYVTIRHKQGEALIEESLVNLEQEFGERFLRVHRNALVGISEIHGLEKNTSGVHRITLNSVDDRLDVSRRHLPTVRKFLRG